jgi:hypothetical protein
MSQDQDMVKTSRILLAGLALLLSSVASTHAAGQTSAPKPKKFPLWNFDEMNFSCRAKGRLQDKGYCASKLMDRIVAQGKSSIPVLISQLTETRKTKEPIYDYWSFTTSGDVAYFILTDLFTDSDWTTFNMPGLDALKDKCDASAETCWRSFLKKHGRKFVQDQWLAAWDANNGRVHWDEQARCFRVSAKTSTHNLNHNDKRFRSKEGGGNLHRRLMRIRSDEQIRARA